uniref:Tc1-like transposase DDE domain-containing protein n=1 Tax=Amphimedon queenslandica TaxID=400682 RepID=A0A1X7TWP6_AMPQE
MSCELHRSSAYSSDLRWPMVHQIEGLEIPYRQVAENLSVDPSTVHRTVAKFRESGNVDRKRYPANHGTAVLTEIDKFIILDAFINKPDTYLHEMKYLLLQETGTDVHISTIMRFLQSSNFTRKKISIVPKQRSDILRAEFLLLMSIFRGHSDFFIFVDESGADRRSCLRRYGYSLRGHPATCRKILVRGERISAIAAISTSGLLDCYTTSKTVNSVTFSDFILSGLLPHLMPFNGTNPHSVVVLDNASIHHVDEVVELMESTGALVQFLPPYSPDLNPIEEAFSKVKYTLKANEIVSDILDPETLFLYSFNSISKEDCINWIRHAGYV